MTSRERIKALLNKEIPDRMGLYEHFWPETLGQYWPEQGYPKDTDPQIYFDYDIWSCGGWVNTEPFLGQFDVLEETDEWRIVRDGRGARQKFWKNKSGTPEHVGFDVKTPEDWAPYRERMLETNIERLGDLQAQRDAVAKAREKDKFVVWGNVFFFESTRQMLGDEVFLPSLLLEPEWIRDFGKVYVDFFRRHYEILFREVGVPDAFWFYEDFGYSNGLFCSPKVLADLIMPYEKEMVGFFKDHGMQVLLHACGDVREAIPLIIDAGFDCLQPMEAKAGCDVVQIAQTYGNRLCYMGNMNVVQLGTNDRDTVRDEVVPKLQKLKELRVPYVFHSDHSIPPNIKLDTYNYALSLYREYGSY